jgi:hypothetical protein
LPTASGLSSAEVSRRLATDGPNTLPAVRPQSPWLLLLRQFTHFFAVMLWVAAALAFLRCRTKNNSSPGHGSRSAGDHQPSDGGVHRQVNAAAQVPK